LASYRLGAVERMWRDAKQRTIGERTSEAPPPVIARNILN
jgi:alkylation response protein AidB-like acyl-CoA dehydrogenase